MNFDKIINAALKRHRVEYGNYYVHSFFDKEELNNECWIALQRAKINYNPNLGQFKRFASKWIKQELQHYINRAKHTLSYTGNEQRNYFHEVIQAHKRKILIGEDKVKGNNLSPLDNCKIKTDRAIDTKMSAVEEAAYVREMKEILKNALGTKRYEILWDRLSNLTFAEIARKHGCSIEHVRQCYEIANTQMRNLLKSHESIYG